MRRQIIIIIVIIALITVLVQADSRKFTKSAKLHSILDPIIDRLTHLKKSHKKRGVFGGSIPTYAVGHDIPFVRHSIIKPFVVDYPMQSVPLGVKIPFKSPVPHLKYPVPVGHHAPVPHSGFGLHFPQVQKPTHVHPTIVKSAWPVNCAPNIPPAPSVTKAVASPPPIPVVPTPTVHVSSPVFPLPAPEVAPVLPFAQAPLPFITRPIFKPFVPISPAIAPAPIHPLPAIIRPGNSIQTSVFATYPKHHFVGAPAPLPQPLIPINLAQHPPINIAPLVHTAPHLPIGQVPIHFAPQPIHKVPVNIFPAGSHFHQHPINVAHAPIPDGPLNVFHGVSHFPQHPINVAHTPIPDGPLNVFHGVSHFPQHPINVAPTPIPDGPLNVFHGVSQFPQHPINIAPTPIPDGPLNIFHGFPQNPQFPINAGPTPVADTPTSVFPGNPQQPADESHIPTPVDEGRFPINVFPTAPVPVGNFPLDLTGHFPVNEIPVGVGPSPTNVPLGVGQFPRPIGPTLIPTADTGVIPPIQQDENVNNLHHFGGVDTNQWMPMTPTASPPQVPPEDQMNFAPTDNTNFNEQHDQNQGYHYQPNSNIPFHEISERFRYRQQLQNEQQSIQNQFSGRLNEQAHRNHFSLRQHLPLRRPLKNFAPYS